MDAFTELINTTDSIQSAIFSDTLDEYLAKRLEKCLANPKSRDGAIRIRDANWDKFREKTEAAVVDALAKNPSLLESTKAIYYEYDTDNGWGGDFFFCTSYNPLSQEDDDWACDYEVSVEAPAAPELAGPELVFANGDAEDYSLFFYALVEVTRNLALVEKSLKEKFPNLPRICVAFHDQDPITRLAKD